MGNFRTFMLMFILVLIFMWIGNLVAGPEGMKTAFLAALAMNFFAYFFSDKLVLKQYAAKEVDARNAPQLYGIVRRLAKNAGLPMPKVYIIPESAPNAFATGRNHSHAAVAATQGLLDLMEPDEIEGVLAHEMTHVKNYDILTGSIAAVFAAAVSFLGNSVRYRTLAGNRSSRNNNGLAVLLAIILLPLAATLVKLSISRTREYAADAGAAKLTHHPEWLAAALHKLDGYAKMETISRASSTTAHLFIVNPFSGNKLASLFSTHPSTAERIARLNKMAGRI